MTCRKKHRLFEEWDAASLCLSQIIESYGALSGATGIERERLSRRADEARRISADAMAELQTHRLLHGC